MNQTKTPDIGHPGKPGNLSRALIEIALGQRAAEHYFRSGRVLNVFTGELLKENVAVYKDRIAYVGPSEKMIGKKTQVEEVEGKVLVPGYMDPHAHTDLYYNPATFSEEVVQSGTTSVFSDMHDLANALGWSGVLQVLKDLPHYPLTYYMAVPSSSPPFPKFEGKELFTVREVRTLLKKPEALGLSEMTAFVRILNKEPRLLNILQAAKTLGKTVEGHTTGVSQDKLNALINAGLTSCHEAISAEDVKRRLRLGLYVMCRGGSIRNDLAQLMEAVRDLSAFDTSRIMLTPDGLFPGDMVECGYLDYVLRQVIDWGIDPSRAIQMVTINPARYFNKELEQGALAPGRRADILVLNDLRDPRPVSVLSKGKWVRRNGRRIFPSLKSFPPGTYDRPFSISQIRPDFFYFQAPNKNPLPVMTILDKTLTRRQDLQVQDSRGMVRADQGKDLAKIAILPRNSGPGGMGLVSGFGADIGAIASSIAHETHSLMVLGFNDADMARAVNQVVEMGGGMVIAKGGTILSRLALPIGGVMSDLKVPRLAKALERVRRCLHERGCPLEDPLWTLGFLSFTSLIELRITFSGVYEVKSGKILYNGFGSGKRRPV
ncbi:MAG: adenine deaminase C-terminal domain-containing protein [Thermodesulfobacteriota bacterium]